MLNVRTYLDIILRIAYFHALPVVREASDTLGEAMRPVIDDDSHGRLTIPHYWAIYVHDGRGPVSPVVGRYLVWFRNPADDPRLAGGYPVRLGDVKRLTKEQFADFLRLNKEAGPGNEPMIVTKYSRPTKGHHFFDNDVGMIGLSAKVNAVVNPIVAADIRDAIGEDLLSVKVKAGSVLRV